VRTFYGNTKYRSEINRWCGSWSKADVSTFLEDSKFFSTLYHAGKVNIILHLVSFSFLLYGLAVRNVLLVLIGLFIFDEMGTPTTIFLYITGTLDSVCE
jgi:hypothetical protein